MPAVRGDGNGEGSKSPSLNLHLQISHSSADAFKGNRFMHMHLLFAHRRTTIPLQLPHGILENPSVLLAYGQLSWHGHHAVPGKSLRENIGIPGFHPGGQNSPAVRRQRSLRRIIVQPVIRGLYPSPMEHMILHVIISDQEQGVVSVMKLRPFCRHILRGDNQHPGFSVRPSQREEVRAFPHPSDPVFAAVQHGAEFPFFQIL